MHLVNVVVTISDVGPSPPREEEMYEFTCAAAPARSFLAILA